MPNHLIHETSPYLLQHAHNPVDWYPWGEEALQKAKAEDKLILVSIGYAACHWCHVMERESFEDGPTAELMNRHFINIKIDREERPDIDHIYMDAVQAMTGSGGWPLNVFLTPDTKPFYGGTYFPPVRAFNRASWKEVLHGVSAGWRDRKEEIFSQAENMLDHMQKSNSFGFSLAGKGDEPAVFTKAICDNMFTQVMKSADREWGGFGNAPKFPQTFTIQFLLQYHYFTGNAEALDQALLSLDKMIAGGIYDQVGGGFSRYSTDREWLAPHFEKMLYDNALLLNVLADAFAITRNSEYEKVARQTIDFLQREMKDAAGGYYAALDADSEGVEGKFYVWSKAEIDEILGEDATLFCRFFDVSEQGNWEEKNILRTLKNVPVFVEENGLDRATFEVQVNTNIALLLAARSKRVRPATDDKILLGWNALLVTSLCRTGTAFNDKNYISAAVETMDFLLEKFKKTDGNFSHVYKNGVAKYPAFLDDLAYLVEACIYLQEVTSNDQYFEHAKSITAHIIDQFADDETPYFFYTAAGQKDVILRKKEIYDGATPSGNAVMAHALFYLGLVFDDAKWRQKSIDMLSGLLPAIQKYPTSFGLWGGSVLRQAAGWNELVITGDDFAAGRDELLSAFIPNKILQSAASGNGFFPLLEGKTGGPGMQVFLCKNYVCKRPFTRVAELAQLLRLNDKF